MPVGNVGPMHRTLSPPRRIRDASVRIESSGFADGPAQALRDFLLEHDVRDLMMVQHPLTPEGGNEHIVTTWRRGVLANRTRIRLPHHPPLTYPLDVLITTPRMHINAWFGFNSLAVARGLAARARGRADVVVQWCVDFVPNRFDDGLATRAYDALDRLACRRADARFELAAAGRDGRNVRHGFMAGEVAPVHSVPMGAWLDRVPTTVAQLNGPWRPVYMGHLVERQGVGPLLEAFAILIREGRSVQADIVGDGPLNEPLRREAAALGIGDNVRFHGFIRDHREVEAILARASVGCATYDTRGDSFTRYADPGKLKAYLAAGLPIVTTPVAPIAPDLAAHGGAEITEFNPRAIADAICTVHSSPADWERRRSDSLAFAQAFGWPAILTPPLEAIGLTAS